MENKVITATTETAAANLFAHDYSVILKLASRGFESLDAAERELREMFGAGYVVYRGGNHVALIWEGERVLLVGERSVPVKRETLGDFGALKAAVSKARSEAQREARSEGRRLTRKTITGREVPNPHKFIRSRGASLVAVNERERCRAFDEPWQWGGTKRELLEALRVALTQTPEAVSLELFGGFDLSETFDFCDYEPEFTSWGLTLWTREDGWKF